jgi:hypothetical protein
VGDLQSLDLYLWGLVNKKFDSSPQHISEYRTIVQRVESEGDSQEKLLDIDSKYHSLVYFEVN